MQSRTPFLDAHIVTNPEKLSVLRDQSCAYGHTTFSATFLCLLHGSDKAWILLHIQRWQCIMDWVLCNEKMKKLKL